MAKTSEFLLITMVILAMTSGRSVTNNRAGIAEAWALAKFDVGLTPQAEGLTTLSELTKVLLSQAREKRKCWRGSLFQIGGRRCQLASARRRRRDAALFAHEFAHR